MTSPMPRPENVRNIAVMGAGGLGRAMARLLDRKSSMRLTAVCDTAGFAVRPAGITGDEMNALPPGATVRDLMEIGEASDDGIGALLARHEDIDGIFLALPNLPNEFIPGVIDRIAASGFRGVVVDALKRTRAVEQVMTRHEALRAAGITYVTGAGATPGLLTAAANLAAQSFVEVEEVVVWFGVGIANWDAYRATVREDIAHLPGFDVAKVKAMTDAEVEAELDRRNGLLELHDMEHADDVLLELAGVLPRARVKVGGLVNTRDAKKPVSTHVRVTGVTFEGKRGTHVFTLADEASMAANVNGPALGYMNAAMWLNGQGIAGVFTSADLMPKFPA